MSARYATHYDVIVIGAGVAGAAAACGLSATRRVVLLERETQPGYHSTGRSVAVFSEIYGSAPIRALSRATRPFLMQPPSGFTAGPLLDERGLIFIARADQLDAFNELSNTDDIAAFTRPLDAAQVSRLLPLLRPGYPAAGLHEPAAAEIDVNALHRGYLALMKRRGGELVTSAEARAIERHGDTWRVITPAGALTAPIIVNAAGAWVDEVATLAGVAPIGIEPRRRTVVIVEGPENFTVAPSPFAIDVDEEFYFRPEVGRMLVSPADETLVPPCDAQPDELDVAVAIDRLETATTLPVRRIVSKWAGLRSFVADRNPVVGFEPAAPGFFWLAGQGGYGIQTSYGMALLASALVGGQQLPASLVDAGLQLGDVSPQRLRTHDS
jgi:D-arginine dehydrogenase